MAKKGPAKLVFDKDNINVLMPTVSGFDDSQTTGRETLLCISVVTRVLNISLDDVPNCKVCHWL